MTTIPTSDLTKQLTHILQAVASGEEFVLTDAGRPVARIVPPLPSAGGQAVSQEEWQRELDEWRREAQLRAERYPAGFVVDDSRETIYSDRENVQR